MGFGAVGAYGAAGGAAALKAIREELLKRVLLERQQQQQQFENDLQLRGSDRADRQLDASLENNRLMREQAESAQRGLQEDRELRRATTAREMLPPETFIPEDDPAVDLMQRAGLAGSLRMAPATTPMGPDFQGPMLDGETPEQAQVGRVRGRLTLPTATQAQKAEDDRRAQAQLDAQMARDRQTQKYQDAQIQAMGRQPATKSERMWVIRNGEPVRVGEDEIQPGDRPYTAKQDNSDVASPYAEEMSQRIRQSVTALKNKVGRWTTGMGSTLSSIPGTDARNFMGELNTLKANIAFGALAEMRAASKTGGALGAVSERELALLESSLGALDQGQSPDHFLSELTKIEGSLDRWAQAKAGGGNAAPRSGSQATAPSMDREYDFVPGRGLVPRTR